MNRRHGLEDTGVRPCLGMMRADVKQPLRILQRMIRSSVRRTQSWPMGVLPVVVALISQRAGPWPLELVPISSVASDFTYPPKPTPDDAGRVGSRHPTCRSAGCLFINGRTRVDQCLLPLSPGSPRGQAMLQGFQSCRSCDPLQPMSSMKKDEYTTWRLEQLAAEPSPYFTCRVFTEQPNSTRTRSLPLPFIYLCSRSNG